MSKLTIENFGPIKKVELDLKKYNIFIGRQGSGKSCILKIAAFCKWVEKIGISLEIFDYYKKGISDSEFTNKYLLDFYKLNDFVRSSSRIIYQSQNISINLSFDKEDIIKLEGGTTLKFQGIFERVSYIPAERCLASAIPNLMSLRIKQNTCTYKYLEDWEDAHKSYKKNNQFSIFDTGASFYYDDDLNADFLSIKKDGYENNIRFENAASGFQSIIPICILTQYYLNRNITLSIGEKQRTELIKKLTDTYDKQKDKSQIINDFTNLYDSYTNKIVKGKEKQDDLTMYLLLSDLVSVLSDNNNSFKQINSSLFLEEPEANIYPETQYELVKWLVASINNGNNNSIFIATHSPYILTSFNNLIQAGNSAMSNPDKRNEINAVMETETFVNFDEIGVFEVKDGTIEDIKDYDLHLIDANSIDGVSDRIQAQFSKLLDYETN